MTESQVVNEWMSQGEARGTLKERRQNLIELLQGRFPTAVPEEVVRRIDERESLEMLRVWFRAAVQAFTFEHFVAVLRRGDASQPTPSSVSRIARTSSPPDASVNGNCPLKRGD